MAWVWAWAWQAATTHASVGSVGKPRLPARAADDKVEKAPAQTGGPKSTATPSRAPVARRRPGHRRTDCRNQVVDL
ncbi:hypothetical protein [Streptomyces broussonetiae]|uniref:Uncharacterized protein n=1 Tax=Streptomyces broussonetiae TaxID=2686304 RepID=A0A6I6NBD1_9ACTN|nr:hypothetical protein [Streptomyces broussonetiae]QHA06245.1 hypothetical protein GQF42_25820 [Streptomyces broussonetiae]